MNRVDKQMQYYNGWLLTGRTKRKKNIVLWESGCPVCGKYGWRQKCRLTEGSCCFVCAHKRLRGTSSPLWKGGANVPQSVLSKIRSTLKRGRTLECTITIEDLEEQWVLQGGRCALSGIPLFFPEVLYSNKNTKKGNASVDRVDSSVGYVRGNIQFTDKRVNLMKQDINQEEFIEICKMIAKHE